MDPNIKVTTHTLLKMKVEGIKIPMLTAYDAITARLIDGVVPLVLVGDSLGNVFAGRSTTIPVTMDQMIYHVEIVSRVIQTSFVIGDMPFMSVTVSPEDARRNAGRFLQEAGAHAVKMEINTLSSVPMVQSVIDIGIPVMAHIGLTPQSVHHLGGYRRQGVEARAAETLVELAIALDKAGCFGIVLELVPSELAAVITKQVSAITIGIGAGPHCDGQVLVTADMLGWNDRKKPAFVKPYASLFDTAKTAVSAFAAEVTDGRFPTI